MKQLISSILIVAVIVFFTPNAYAANTNSADFEDASSQSLSTADNADLDITGNMTVQFWFKPETAHPSPEDVFLSKYNGTGNQRAYYFSQDASGPNNRIKMILSGDGISAFQEAWYYTLTAGTWTHLAFIYTAATAATELCVNGVSEGAADEQDTMPTSILNSTDDLEIGAISAGNFLDGRLDDVRLYNTNRTCTNVLNDYQQELNGNEANLQAYWMFNDTEGNLQDRGTATDPAGVTANDLTNVNTVTFPTDVPFPIAVAVIPQDFWFWFLWGL